MSVRDERALPEAPGTREVSIGPDGEPESGLNRVISGKLLLLFVIGDILGAGIYAVVGEVAGEVGGGIWASFALAFGLAFLTAGSYAELVTRFPRAAGAALYVHKAWKRPFFTFLVAFAVVMSGITSASTAARAFGGDYLGEFLRIPVVPVALGFIVLLAVINYIGISESVKVNVVLTLIEITGLIVVVVVGAVALMGGDADPSRALDFGDASNVPFAIVGGASLAFFSMVGFEDSVNVAEEVQDPRRVYPKALFGGLAIVLAVYLVVTVLAVAVVEPGSLSGSDGPLLEVIKQGPLGIDPKLFSVIALIAVTNTALINMIMASRLTYGMAREGIVPRVLGRVDGRRRTPWVAILFTSAIAFVLIPTGDLGSLADTTVLLLLTVFTLVNIAVLVLRRRTDAEVDVSDDGFRAPTWMPVLGAVSSVALLTQQEGAVWLRAAVLVGVGAVLWGINAAFGRRVEDLDVERLSE